MKKLFLFIIYTCITSFSFAQIHEIGFFAGGTNFIGDIGDEHYINPKEMGLGLVYKYNLNPRIALRLNYTHLKISGNDNNSSNSYRKTRHYNFKNRLQELAVGTEFSFFEYDIRDNRIAYTPYILTQIARYKYTVPTAELENDEVIFKKAFSYAIPVGLGFKGRVTDHIAFSIEAAIRFTFKDDLDGTTDKVSSLNYGGNGNDSFVFTGVSIVYAFGRPVCYYNIED